MVYAFVATAAIFGCILLLIDELEMTPSCLPLRVCMLIATVVASIIVIVTTNVLAAAIAYASGIVTTATSSHVTVELHTRNRSVTQPRECVKVVAGAAGGEPELAVQRRIAEQEAYNADLVSTPFLTQATPLLSGATPHQRGVAPHLPMVHKLLITDHKHRGMAMPHQAMGEL